MARFYESNTEAMADIKRMAELEAEGSKALEDHGALFKDEVVK
jgi:hypothetical protein